MTTQAPHHRGSAPSTAELAISARGLRKTYRNHKGRHVAVAGLDLDVPLGGVHGFLGPNGSGKTTTIRMLLGLIRADAGTMTIFGSEIPKHLPEVVDRVGAIVESPKFFPAFSGRKNLQLLAEAIGRPKGIVDEILEQTGLGERGKDKYRTYSLGMKQRLGIAGALLGEPTLLILDEPTNGLDPAGIRDMRALVRLLAQDGPTVLISSHLLAEVQQVCDWLVVIEHGRLVFQGPTARLLAGGDELTLRCEHLADLPRLQGLLTGRGLVATLADDRVHVELAGANAISGRSGLNGLLGEINRAAMAEQVTLVELTITRASLEERYLTLTKKPTEEPTADSTEVGAR